MKTVFVNDEVSQNIIGPMIHIRLLVHYSVWHFLHTVNNYHFTSWSWNIEQESTFCCFFHSCDAIKVWPIWTINDWTKLKWMKAAPKIDWSNDPQLTTDAIFSVTFPNCHVTHVPWLKSKRSTFLSFLACESSILKLGWSTTGYLCTIQ